eukprot:83296-Hanusia_phi.AAC.1
MFPCHTSFPLLPSSSEQKRASEQESRTLMRGSRLGKAEGVDQVIQDDEDFLLQLLVLTCLGQLRQLQGDILVAQDRFGFFEGGPAKER